MHSRRLAVEIGCLLAVKAGLLALLYVAFFGPERRLEPTPETVQRHFAPAQAR